MSRISRRGVVLGGLVAGLVINLSEYVLNEVVLGPEVAAALAAHNLPPIGGGAITAFLVYGFALGVVLVWLYAAMRPRFGAGPRTAGLAAIAAWFLAYFTGSLNFAALGLMPVRMLLVGLLWGLIELLAAALAGGWLYSED